MCKTTRSYKTDKKVTNLLCTLYRMRLINEGKLLSAVMWISTTSPAISFKALRVMFVWYREKLNIKYRQN